MSYIVTDMQGTDTEVKIGSFYAGDYRAKVHLTTGAGETLHSRTVYLSPEQARSLAAALIEHATELETRLLAEETGLATE